MTCRASSVFACSFHRIAAARGQRWLTDARCAVVPAGIILQLRLDGAMDIPVDAIGAEAGDEAIRAKYGKHARLHAREAQGCSVALHELVDRGQLLGAL